MKITKITIIYFLLIILFLIFLAKTSYNIGQHNASLTIKESTPKQVATAMQSDNFYGEYERTMLLLSGKVKNSLQQDQDTIVSFETTDSPNVLGSVSCNVGKGHNSIKQGDFIRVLTVAYDAERKNGADVYMPNCYLLK